MVAISTSNTGPASDRRIGARPARRIYVACAWLFAAGIVVQVFLAGVAVLVDAGRWGDHRAFGSLLFHLPPVMLVAALAARLPRRIVGLSALAVALVLLQFVLVSLPAVGGAGLIRALHPVNALALFWLALTLARGAQPPLFARQEDAAQSTV